MVQVVTPAAHRPVDPNTIIPPVVAANAAAADELQKKFIEEQAEAAKETPSEGFGEPSSDEPHEEPSRAPAPEKPKTPAPAGAEDESWQSRYHSMKGRYEREEQRVRQLAEQVSSMQRAIDQLSMQPRPAPAPAPAPTRLLTDEEVNDFGPEFLDVVGRRAEEIFAPKAQAYETKIAQLEQQLQGVGGFVQRTGRQEMMDQLDEEVPGWRDVNLSNEFKAWLALPDPFTGAIRHEQLRAAWDRNAVSQAKAFFKGFLAEEAAIAPARGDPATARAPRNGSPRPSLETFAAPGRAKSAATGNVPAEKPVYTRAEITKFYTDVAAGRWRGRDEERKRRDADISQAVVEGRIA